MVRIKLNPEIREFIDSNLKNRQYLTYLELIAAVRQKYGVEVSKATISKRARDAGISLSRGRKGMIAGGRKPAHSIFLKAAGSFFLKAAELEMGLLAAVNRVLRTNTESRQARKALKLAQQINAFLLYSPFFELKAFSTIPLSQSRELHYLTEQKNIPPQQEVAQYGQFLASQGLLPLMVKEVKKTSTEALCICLEYAGQTFYIDAQLRSVWANPKIPHSFCATLNKANSYVENTFLFPNTSRPLILQAAPGYTFLPPEMLGLLRCFEQAPKEPIAKVLIMDKSAETLGSWHNLKPPQRCYFIAPLSPWQAEKLQSVKMIKDYQTLRIGVNRETMAVGDAWVELVDTQLSKNIRVRAALIKGKEQRLVLITNISPQQERYIKKIAELYFSRWPQEELKNYYDLLEEAHREVQVRSKSKLPSIESASALSYRQKPQETFWLFAEQLHRYCLGHFFPTEYSQESLPSMAQKFYKQSGYLKIKRTCWEVTLSPFDQKKLQQSAQIACQKINQSGIKISHQKDFRIYLQTNR